MPGSASWSERHSSQSQSLPARITTVRYGRPFSLGPAVVMLAFGGTIAFAAGHALMLAEGLKGGLTRAGELHDAVFQLAKRMNVPLRRLYILPEGG